MKIIGRFCSLICLIGISACVTSGPLARSIASTEMSKLNWGSLFESPATLTPLAKQRIHRVVEVAQQNLALNIAPVTALHLQGVLSSDPAYQASNQALSSVVPLFDLAVCARVAEPVLGASCAQKAKSGILAWAATFQPIGDPINENRFVPLLQAIDLMLPLFSSEENALALAWVRKFAVQGDAFYAKLKPTDTRIVNNWMAWHLLIRAMSSVILNDTSLQNDTKVQLQNFLTRNFLKTNGAVDGRTEDFVQRDAFHYHIYDLLPLVELALFAPGFNSLELKTDLLLGIDFMQPYFLGKTQHIEFLKSSVPFDSKRCQAGQKDYCPLPWVASSARELLRISRALLPQLREWTASVVDDQYDPRIKLMAVIYGDGEK